MLRNFWASILLVVILSSSNTSPFFANEVVVAESATIQAEDNERAGLALYPDEPLSQIPEDSLTVKYLIEHRTALHGRIVKVKGIVVEVLLGEDACPTCDQSDINVPCPGGCGRPYIFLADSVSKGRDLNYDLLVLVSEEEDSYSPQQFVEVEGTINASKVAVYLEKKYPANLQGW